jgi:hypothetical protein
MAKGVGGHGKGHQAEPVTVELSDARSVDAVDEVVVESPTAEHWLKQARQEVEVACAEQVQQLLLIDGHGLRPRHVGGFGGGWEPTHFCLR